MHCKLSLAIVITTTGLIGCAVEPDYVHPEVKLPEHFHNQAVLDTRRSSAVAAFAKGTASMIEVLEIDDSLLRVSDAQVQAQTESARAAVAAFKSLGGGWNPPSLELATIR